MTDGRKPQLGASRAELTRDGGPAGRVGLFSFFLGVLTATLIVVVLFLTYRVVVRRIAAARSPIQYLPKDVVDELTAIRAVVGNANNPTRQLVHDTILVEPDARRAYVLRPNKAVAAHLLRTRVPFNVDPPVLYIDERSPQSDRLREYLRAQTRISYSFSTDADGFRTTLPVVTAARKILVIGDSVAFGVGVTDDQTIASWLQRMAGGQYRLVNAANGGYNAEQAIETARLLSDSERYSALIYVACQNDFMLAEDWAAELEKTLRGIRPLAGRFDENVVVFLHTYMEYVIEDVFAGGGWSRSQIEATNRLRERLQTAAPRLGFSFEDWTLIAEKYRRETGSPFSPFALYADHCHFSSLGNRLAAERIHEALIARRVATRRIAE